MGHTLEPGVTCLWQGDPMSTLIEQLDHALTEFGTRVSQVGPDQWHEPTPLPDWDVRTLVAHVVDECRWAPYLLTGGSPAEAGDRFATDPLGEDPGAAWSAASTEAAGAFGREGALDQSVQVTAGEISARDYVWQLTVELTVHAWDLARGIGADDRLDPELVRRIHSEMAKDVDELTAKAAARGFAPRIPMPAHADLQTRMLGLVGRRS